MTKSFDEILDLFDNAICNAFNARDTKNIVAKIESENELLKAIKDLCEEKTSLFLKLHDKEKQIALLENYNRFIKQICEEELAKNAKAK